MDTNTLSRANAPLKFIRDVASETDFFGSHEKVAHTIGDVLRTNDDIKVIGLLGPWGSGKSTVVGLLGSYLSAKHSETELVFTYDAWLHQSDPPRRAFLETMLHFLIEQGLTQEEAWSEKLDVLNRRTEDSVTTTTPRLTIPGTVMTLSLLLIPFGLKFASLDWYKGFATENVPHAKWFFIGGLCSIGVPVLLGTLFYLAWRPTLKFWKGAFWKSWNWNKHKRPHQNESILSLFMNRETKTNFNRVTKDPEPTAIEFQDAFREAVAIATSSQRRFIIVVDNLDRLPENEAIALWATIRSFFLGSNGGLRSRIERKQPVVILPIAEDAIERLYASAKDDAKALARSFMEKTFDLTFHVNRPVLTQWTDFLEHQMKHVFGASYEEAWSFATGRFYERYSAMNGSPTITPRGINTLINAIGTRWLQWKGSVQFASIAYYCTFRESIEKDIVAAATTPFAPIGDYDKQWQNSVAALYYGVEPADAAQVLLDQPLLRAVIERDEDAFARLALIPGFYLRLHKITEGNKTDANPDILFNTAHLLGTTAEGVEVVAVRQIWSLLRETVPGIQQLQVFGPAASDGLLRMFKACPASEIKSFLQACTTLISAALVEASQSDEFAEAFTSFWLGATPNLASHDLLPERIFVPGSAAIFGDVALRFAVSPSLAKRLASTASGQSVASHIADLVVNSGDATQTEKKIRAIAATGKTVDWSKDFERMIAIVRAPVTNAHATACALLILGLQLSQKGISNTDYQSIATDGTLVARLNEAFAQKLDNVMARVLALLILVSKPFVIPEAAQWPAMLSARTSILEDMDRELDEFSGAKISPVTRLVSAVRASADIKGLAIELMGRRIAAGRLGRIAIDDAIDNLGAYLDLFPGTALKDQFVIRLASYETFWEVLGKRALDGTAGQIFQILIAQDATSEESRRVLKERLIAEPVATWETGILTGSSTLSLALELASLEPDWREVSKVYTALDSTLAMLIDDADDAKTERWFRATQLISIDARRTLFKNLRDRINSGASIANLALLIKTGSRDLLLDGGFAEESDESVRHVVLPLVASKEGLTVLASIEDTTAEWIARAEPSSRTFLVERLGALESAADDEDRQRFGQLRRAWSLEPLIVMGSGDSKGEST